MLLINIKSTLAKANVRERVISIFFYTNISSEQCVQWNYISSSFSLVCSTTSSLFSICLLVLYHIQMKYHDMKENPIINSTFNRLRVALLFRFIYLLSALWVDIAIAMELSAGWSYKHHLHYLSLLLCVPSILPVSLPFVLPFTTRHPLLTSAASVLSSKFNYSLPLHSNTESTEDVYVCLTISVSSSVRAFTHNENITPILELWNAKML